MNKNEDTEDSNIFSKELNEKIELNQKTCIATIIQGCLLVNKKGAINLHQARDLADSIDVFTMKDADKNKLSQIDAIKILMNVLNIGQSNGIFELDEARVLANVIDIIGNKELLKEDYDMKQISFV